ncbi:MAG: phospho-N-acetylmuramoyl-pentapeptide-transferase [Actinomycetia bacterium]|nr:phospho-N-acetylmuramoyl-pentapeptide-transferase [Actinomycetes bacterium]
MTLATGAAASLVVAWLLGWVLIPWLRRLKVGQVVREVGPQSHLSKQGTPTMGGLLFVLPAAAFTLLTFPRSAAAWDLAGLLLAYAAIGFADDYLKVVKRRPLGLRARQKLAFQFLAAGIFTWQAMRLGAADVLKVPWDGWWHPGVWFVPLALLAIVGSSNAVNETDGLDGLAGGAAVIALVFFAAYAGRVGDPVALFFAAVLAAGVVGFLRYNWHPAAVFMGDTGSLALGAALAGLAVLTRSTLLLPVVGGLFVLETLSVIVQVAAFRAFGRRVLRMSPLHHHFELAGWPEARVVTTFWAVALVCALVAWI